MFSTFKIFGCSSVVIILRLKVSLTHMQQAETTARSEINESKLRVVVAQKIPNNKQGENKFVASFVDVCRVSINALR